MIENAALSNLGEIRAFCKEIKLPYSERMVFQMHQEEGFPMAKLGRDWESDKLAIIHWRRNRVTAREDAKIVIGDYAEERNSLVPIAEKWANHQHGKECPSPATDAEKDAWYAAWSGCFHRKMSDLWAVWTRDKAKAAEAANAAWDRTYRTTLRELQKEA